MTFPGWSMWTVIPEIYRVIEEATWPQIPQAKGKPKVQFGAFTNLPAGESIIVTGATDRADSEPHTMGAVSGREGMQTPIVVATSVPGLDALASFNRLAELGKTLEGLFRDLTTGKPIITEAIDEAGLFSLWIYSAE